jgi:hypothetical protein
MSPKPARSTREKVADVHCGIGSCGVPRPGLDDYVTGTEATSGVTTAGGRSCCLSPDEEGRMTDPDDGRGVMVPAERIDVGHSHGKGGKRAFAVQHRGEMQEIEPDARPVRCAPEILVEIPEGAVHMGRGRDLLTALQAPREPCGEDGQQENREPDGRVASFSFIRLRPSPRRQSPRAGGGWGTRGPPAGGPRIPGSATPQVRSSLSTSDRRRTPFRAGRRLRCGTRPR